MFFKDVTGQDKLKQQLVRSTQQGFIPHAQLFAGRAGYGGFPLALAYARYLNCRARTDTDACGRCPSCMKYNELAHPDLHFVFPIAKKDGEKPDETTCDSRLPDWRKFLKMNTYFDLGGWQNYLKTDKQVMIYAKEADEIFHKVSLRVYEADYRILLVWTPERMHPSCANKLLKIVEEPPEHTLIFMVSDTPDAILGTILSRLQRLNVGPIDTEALAAAAEKNFGVEPSQALNHAHLAHGDYLQLAETVQIGEENLLFLEYFKRIMRNAWTRNVKEMKRLTEEIAKNFGRDRQKKFLAYCQRLIRENFIYRFQAGEMNYMNEEESLFAARFAVNVNERNVFDFIEELSDAERHIAQNVNSKMVFFDLMLHLTALLKK